MDQQSVESLLRRLVERVEESERRYGEALEELHTRLDQLSQTTDAARAASAPEDAAAFGRLHDHVSTLARRLEQEASTPLDDFERLGKALSAGLEAPAAAASEYPFRSLEETEAPKAPAPAFDFSVPETTYSVPPIAAPAAPAEDDERDLDKRLVDIAHRFEQSIGTAIPATAIEALNARLDEIYTELSEALNQTAKRDSLEHVERQLAEMSQQIGRAELQLAKMGSIESQLLKLIERADAAPDLGDLGDLASKAAEEAVRRMSAEAEPQAPARIEAVERDLAAMQEKTKASDERIAGTLAAVHDSLKKLLQQVEQGSPLPQRPRLPFADRQGRPIQAQAALAPEAQPASGQAAQAQAPQAPKAPQMPVAPVPAPQAAAPKAAASPQPQPRPAEAPRDEAVDLDKEPAPRLKAPQPVDAEYEIPDDLVAAARRAAQAAAAKAQERSAVGRLRRTARAALPGSATEADAQTKKNRPILIIAAAVLLALSAALLYGRLKSKPEPEVAPPPAVEQTVPAPAEPAPAEPESIPAEPDRSGAWQPEVLPEEPAENEFGQADDAPGFTEIAKSPRRTSMQASELVPTPELVSHRPDGGPALPPGVVFSIQEPHAGAQGAAPAQPGLLLPAEAIGPVALRQAAANGDAAAQYIVALRYQRDENTAEAVRWLERAASAGLAPAQYRLAALYERGQGVAKDLGRARSWYQSAAEKGNVKAMHNLAVTASAREGGAADYALAAKWYGEAAAHGLADSQFNLGILAEHGLGQEPNPAEAYKWFSLAAKAGDKEAAKRRDVLKTKLDAATRAAAEQAVKAWTAKPTDPDANEIEEKAEWAEAALAGGAGANAALLSRAQSLLNKLGYDAGTADGVMGERTRTAIRNFQRQNGLAETGEVTAPLVTTLEQAAG